MAKTKYRRRSNAGKVVVALLIVAILVAGVLCCGYASRTDEGWFKNSDLATWHWNDPECEHEYGEDGKCIHCGADKPAEQETPNGGEENKEPEQTPAADPTRFFFAITPAA